MKKLGFGLMRLPLLDPGDTRSIDIETVKKMVDLFLARGFTYFDTAACYHQGSSEIAFREAVVKRYPRSAYTITDKLTMFMLQNEADMPGFFKAQLERLGLDYMDYYWLHAMSQSSYRQAEEMHAFAFVQKLKEQGKVKHIGFSFHDDAELLDEILSKHPEMEYVQLQLNYLDWEDAGVQSRLCYEVASKHGKPVIVMEPVKGGSLVNIPKEAEQLFHTCRPAYSTASWAIRFAASLDNVMTVLSGMSDEAQVEDNTGYMTEFQPLDDQEQAVIAQVTEIIKNSITIPCTGCRYCVDGCPKNIAIPDYFSIYNDLTRLGVAHKADAHSAYAHLAQTHGKASDCIKCGRCEQRCPQHLPIRKHLESVAQALEH